MFCCFLNRGSIRFKWVVSFIYKIYIYTYMLLTFHVILSIKCSVWYLCTCMQCRYMSRWTIITMIYIWNVFYLYFLPFFPTNTFWWAFHMHKQSRFLLRLLSSSSCSPAQDCLLQLILKTFIYKTKMFNTAMTNLTFCTADSESSTKMCC